MPRPLRPLVISGFMGTGKSTVGPIVAARAKATFVDLDRAIEQSVGASVQTIFHERGEPAFRALEAGALQRALTEPGPVVVSVGGGALLNRQARRDLLTRAHVVTLTASAATILARTADASRPLLGPPETRAERIAELLDARRDAYREAHAFIATDDAAPETVADAVLSSWRRPTVVVPLAERSYVICLAERTEAARLLATSVAALLPSSVFLITDETVHNLYGAEVEQGFLAAGVPIRAVVKLVPGETQKQLSSVEGALRTMVEAHADRGSVVVALGGGVVSDMAGFAAATLLRGVRWVVAPTTLLSMVDASVGGKTGVDLGGAKNAVGAFHQPSQVITAPGFTASESPRFFSSGLAEVVKTAALGDPALFEILEHSAERILLRDEGLLEKVVFRSIAVKAAIVGRDDLETGERAHLNFGHTIGHALEAEGAYVRLTHGEAVSLGMVAMLRMGVALGITSAAFASRVEALLQRLSLPTDIASQPMDRALAFLAHDKKRRGDSVRAVLVRDLGHPLLHSLALTEIGRFFTGSELPGH